MKQQLPKIITGVFAFPILALCSVTVGLCLLSYNVWVNKCLPWECAPKRNFAVTDLGIPAHFFPANSIGGSWNTEGESFGAVEHGSMNLFWRKGQGAAIYIVQRFATEDQAHEFFNVLRNDGVLPTSSDVTFRSTTADAYLIGCGYSPFGEERCELLARYKEFVIVLNVTIDRLMTVQGFEEIVIFVDNQISTKLVSP